MSDVVIRCEGVGKRYAFGQRQRYRTLRDTITDAFRLPFRRSTTHQVAESLWALKDVSLEIRHGEVLGVIGRNGAGKSTLLKVLSRITKPTTGRVEIRGRVGALLEIGTGFHPELTGRENIYLSGAVLGMRRREIQEKFDEIVEFSECGRFLDMPIKHYSPGMSARLAFAVAAHLGTEILFVDEVLSVGDAAFQKKCLGKIGDAAQEGRTVLFVSHNLVAVQSLCTRAICLHEGKLVIDDAPAVVTSRYFADWIPSNTEITYRDLEKAPGNEVCRLHRACVRPVDGSASDLITVRTAFVAEFEYWKLMPNTTVDVWACFYNEAGVFVLETARFGDSSEPVGLVRSRLIVPGDLLNNGTHRITLFICQSQSVILKIDDLLVFEVHDAASDLRGLYHGPLGGAVRPQLQWTMEHLTDLKPVR